MSAWAEVRRHPTGDDEPGNGKTGATVATPSSHRLSHKQVGMLTLVAGVLALVYGANFAVIRTVAGAEGRTLFSIYPIFFALVFLVYLAAAGQSSARRDRVYRAARFSIP
jgi:hypothetical protein